MSEKTYTFTITLQGTGQTIEEAWIDALVEFHSDPGDVPDDEDVELIHEEEVEELFEGTTEALNDLVNIRSNSSK
jgi:hypothetical protein